MKKQYKLIGIDKSNGKDYTCKLYGKIKNGKIYIEKEVFIKPKKENNHV